MTDFEKQYIDLMEKLVNTMGSIDVSLSNMVEHQDTMTNSIINIDNELDKCMTESKGYYSLNVTSSIE